MRLIDWPMISDWKTICFPLEITAYSAVGVSNKYKAGGEYAFTLAWVIRSERMIYHAPEAN